MTPADLAAREARAAAAAREKRGVWEQARAAIASASDVPALAAALRASWAECERLRAAAAQAVRERDALAGAVRAYLAAADGWERETTRWRREYVANLSAQDAAIAAARETMGTARAALDAALAGCP